MADVLASRKTQQLTQLASISDGNHFSIAENFTDEGIPYYRGQDVTGKPFVELSTPKYIDERSFNEPHMIRSHLKQGDVLLSIVGTIGESSLVTSTQPATCSCKLAILRPKNIDPNYLAVVLQSDYGKSQIARLTRGAIQMGLLLEDMDQVLIPSFSKDFESGISQIVKLSQIAIETSKTTQQQAEQTLLRILDLENWQPQQALSYERKASDVFAAERLDAEYYYPEKTAALKFLESLPGKTVGKMFVSIRDLWQPDTASKNQQVQNYDLTDALSPFLDTEKEPVYPEEISSTKKKLSQGQIIVSRLRSYLKEIALVLHDTNIPMVASTEFIVLQPTGQMNIETLMVYLRSILPQTIFKWSQDGSNHPRFDEKELLNLSRPV
ncbi:MAG: hypothetical protein JG718_08995 [Candidatus Thiothrix moscowensis]|nr:hypothetical protein [Candidatus Thiothrix moscowensis]